VGLLGGGCRPPAYKSAALAISPQQLQFEDERVKNSKSLKNHVES